MMPDADAYEILPVQMKKALLLRRLRVLAILLNE